MPISLRITASSTPFRMTARLPFSPCSPIQHGTISSYMSDTPFRATPRSSPLHSQFESDLVHTTHTFHRATAKTPGQSKSSSTCANKSLGRSFPSRVITQRNTCHPSRTAPTRTSTDSITWQNYYKLPTPLAGIPSTPSSVLSLTHTVAYNLSSMSSPPTTTKRNSTPRHSTPDTTTLATSPP